MGNLIARIPIGMTTVYVTAPKCRHLNRNPCDTVRGTRTVKNVSPYEFRIGITFNTQFWCVDQYKAASFGSDL